jgi:hypothetical protein
MGVRKRTSHISIDGIQVSNSKLTAKTYKPKIVDLISELFPWSEVFSQGTLKERRGGCWFTEIGL